MQGKHKGFGFLVTQLWARVKHAGSLGCMPVLAVPWALSHTIITINSMLDIVKWQWSTTWTLWQQSSIKWYQRNVALNGYKALNGTILLLIHIVQKYAKQLYRIMQNYGVVSQAHEMTYWSSWKFWLGRVQAFKCRRVQALCSNLAKKRASLCSTEPKKIAIFAWIMQNYAK